MSVKIMNLPRRKPPKVPETLIQISWAKFEINSSAGREEVKQMEGRHEDKFNQVVVLSKKKVKESGNEKEVGKECMGQMNRRTA
jgi:hypothetical protein